MTPPADQATADPAFGALITERRPSSILRFVAFAMPAVAVLLLYAAWRQYSWGVAGRPAAINLTVAAAAVLALSVPPLLLLRTRYEFRELGVVVRRGRVRRSMLYEHAERFVYRVVRRYSNGMYAGTVVTFTLKAKGRRTIRWSGRHREKPAGWAFLTMGRQFKGEDELDVVKLVVADAMADRWLDRLAAGETISWAGRLDMSEQAVVPRKGPRKGDRIPYADINRVSANDGLVHLFHREDDRPFVTFETGEENFWPGLRVAERLWSIAPGESAHVGAGKAAVGDG